MNIAIVSPSKRAYSETFIQAHQEYLKGTLFFYSNGEIPTEVSGDVIYISRKKRLLDILKGHFNLNRFSLTEQALITSLKKNKIDLIFAEYGTAGLKMLPVCKELDLPLIVHFHGFDASRRDLVNNTSIYQKLFADASYVIVVSRKMEKDLLRFGCPREKLIYNVYGPRQEFLNVTPDFSRPQFIAIGRFVNKKAPYYLILSFKEVIRKFPEAKLIIAGEGELLNTCKNLVKYYGLEENILLAGVISRDEYLGYLQESTAMVQHSITADDGDSEGTPVAILEASAAGIPVIATKHGGIPDVIIDRITGFLVDEHDVLAMADRMEKLLKDKLLVMEMGKAGKENIRKNFSLAEHIKKLDDLIWSAIEKHQNRID